MRKSKKIISAALTATALSLMAIPTFAASSSSSDDNGLLFGIVGGVIAVGAIIVIAAMLSANKKKKAKAAAAKAEAAKKEAEAKIVEVEAEEPKNEETADEAEIVEEVTPVAPETVEVESDEEEPEPELQYEAPVKLESVEVVTDTTPEVIEIPTIEVEDTTPEAEEIAEEINEPAVAEEAPEAEIVEDVAEEVVEAPAESAEEAVDAEEVTENTEESKSDLAEGEFRDAETGCIYTYNADGVPVAPEGMVIRYKWSFLGRLIQADNTVKYRYMMIRRLLLSYKKVRSNVSWNFDSYFLGRKPLVKIKVRGKHLVVYFNLDPAEMAGTKYVGEDASKISRYKAVPFAYKINGERKLNYAMELVRKLMEDTPFVDAEFIQPGQAKYAIPTQSFAELFTNGYIKIGGFLAVSRASSVADDDDEDGPVNDANDADEEDVSAEVEENAAPIEAEVFNYTPSKKDA